MRALFLAALLLAPSVAAAAPAPSVALDAPATVEAGLPFHATVCLDAPAQLRVALTLDGKAVSANASRYGAQLPMGCRDIIVEPRDVAGDATLVVHARANTSGGVGVASASVRVARSAVPVALVEAWGKPFAGAVLRNDGDAPLALDAFTLGGVALSGELAPHEPRRVETPGVANWTLARGARVLAWLPAPKPATIVDANGATRRMGVSSFASVREPIDGSWTAFSTPDAGDAPVLALLDGATSEILVEAYTITSTDVGAALADALGRGVRERILLEGSPVGGVPSAEQGIVAALEARGADVYFLKSAPSFPVRYQTQHAKLIVVDREATLVSTENLHDSSYPPIAGMPGTRGHGLVARNATLARELAAVMDADASPWPDVQRANVTAPPATLARAAASRAGPTLTVNGSFETRVVLSPESSSEVRALLGRANATLDVEELFADARNDTMLDGLVAAARRGVAVRLLLDGAVDDGRNAADVANLTGIAARERLPLAAKLAGPKHTLHAKLVLADGAAFYVGSMNWGEASMRKNREAGLVVEAPPLAAWYEASFERDWAPPAAEVRAAGNDIAPLFALVLALALALSPTASRRRP